MHKQRMPLFGSIPAEFPSEYSLEESVERLQAVVKKLAGLAVLVSDQAVGRVAPENVHITRVGFNAGLMGPAFQGHFHQDTDRIVLRGAFSVPLGVKVGLLLYCGL